jgi:hypothetical protein
LEKSTQSTYSNGKNGSLVFRNDPPAESGGRPAVVARPADRHDLDTIHYGAVVTEAPVRV